jgi:predicted metal-dependent HD superfamily phosphohydrolase
MLKQTFLALTGKYTSNSQLQEDLWQEIETNYSADNRYYHNLHHLEYLLEKLTAVKQEINDWDTVLFSLYYHDIIYNATSNDNEEKSAECAAKDLQLLGLISDKCVMQILATKGHTVSTDNDTNLFTDADLSILGESWELYQEYFQKIRKEYAIYPDAVYSPGRTKVLNHFLSMERIFKTDIFHEKFELNAKNNLTRELVHLQEAF